MEDSQFPVYIPDADYDLEDEIGNDTSSHLEEEEVFANPTYELDVQADRVDRDEVENDDDVNTNHVNEPVEVSDHQEEVAVLDVVAVEHNETSSERSSEVEHRGHDMMNGAIPTIPARPNGMDVERAGDFPTTRHDLTAEGKRIRERELTICMSMFVVTIILLVVSLVIYFAVSSARSLSTTTESPMSSATP
ncbi:uncharacterized protein LOC135153889 [Lytechinus pictus]|uniref:uncharacterized protein LOC135153889 n=1 Tax=Lytechinus pictus TaxID=7653 RepID=UPI0030BA167C